MQIGNAKPTETSQELFNKVNLAVERQRKRFGTATMWNAYMTPALIEEHCKLNEHAEQVMQKAFTVLKLSMRGYHKILKVARTIADLDGSDTIEALHLQEAIMYRSLDQYLEQQRG